MKKGSTAQWLNGAKGKKDGERGRRGEKEMTGITDFQDSKTAGPQDRKTTLQLNQIPF
ncbi:MAG: hypothetical protein HZB98_10980 [Bacteroidia bacterium]|nr:hypothetical protein [Bacteroidia bacterium]